MVFSKRNTFTKAQIFGRKTGIATKRRRYIRRALPLQPLRFCNLEFLDLLISLKNFLSRYSSSFIRNICRQVIFLRSRMFRRIIRKCRH